MLILQLTLLHFLLLILICSAVKLITLCLLCCIELFYINTKINLQHSYTIFSKRMVSLTFSMMKIIVPPSTPRFPVKLICSAAFRYALNFFAYSSMQQSVRNLLLRMGNLTSSQLYGCPCYQ